MRKSLYVLNVEGYAPGITALTYPLLRFYADRIGADFHVIDARKFPDWPVVYEKFQIYELAQRRGDEWSIYLDSDALVHPEAIDFTEHLPKDTVAHHGADMAAVRWKYDRFFRRDGRNIGSCNWWTIASAWCVDLWQPLEDLTYLEALDRIRPTMHELQTVITPAHLIDDFVCSRNIAKYGLKFTTLLELLPTIGLPEAQFAWHAYTVPVDEKIRQMTEVLEKWNLPDRIRTYGQ